MFDSPYGVMDCLYVRSSAKDLLDVGAYKHL